MKYKIFIIPAIAFLLTFSVAPAFADGNDRVENESEAEVVNEFEVMSNTGTNFADGSWGGDGGDGGDIRNGRMMRPGPGPLAGPQLLLPPVPFEGGDVDEVTTGDGAMGGNASDGGTVISGDATTRLTIEGHINHNDTRINRGEDVDDNTRVINRNRAMLLNGGAVAANTGENEASGSYGGDGGEGGNVSNSGPGDVEESSTGSGAGGGTGALGGLVQTGISDARASVVERVNENITRINR